jgi:hypothetical protein
MTTETEKKALNLAKGGRKGGTIFPRISLSDAINYAHKLVVKTHSAPQPKDIIFSGVFGAKGGKGNVRMSALKQYGFIKNDQKGNFLAEELAKKIEAAPPEELISLYRQAILKPTVFKKLFDTFHGDTVSKAKLKQRAADFKVHPDETATCVDLYLSGMKIAGLVVVDGDQVTHVASSDVDTVLVTSVTVEMEPEAIDEDMGDEESIEGLDSTDEGAGVAENDANHDKKPAKAKPSPKGAVELGPRAVFNVNVTLDSSLDIEKLQKQLELLKRYGAI